VNSYSAQFRTSGQGGKKKRRKKSELSARLRPSPRLSNPCHSVPGQLRGKGEKKELVAPARDRAKLNGELITGSSHLAEHRLYLAGLLRKPRARKEDHLGFERIFFCPLPAA